MLELSIVEVIEQEGAPQSAAMDTTVDIALLKASTNFAITEEKLELCIEGDQYVTKVRSKVSEVGLTCGLSSVPQCCLRDD